MGAPGTGGAQVGAVAGFICREAVCVEAVSVRKLPSMSAAAGTIIRPERACLVKSLRSTDQLYRQSGRGLPLLENDRSEFAQKLAPDEPEMSSGCSVESRIQAGFLSGGI